MGGRMVRDGDTLNEGLVDGDTLKEGLVEIGIH